MAEIVKSSSMFSFQDDIGPSIYSLEELSRLRLSEQQPSVSMPDIYMSMDILWLTLTQPSLHLQISERQSITPDSSSPMPTTSLLRAPEKDKVDVQYQSMEAIEPGPYGEGSVPQSTRPILGFGEMSRGQVQNNNVSEKALQFIDSENGSSATQEEIELNSRKESSFLSTNRGSDVAGKSEEEVGAVGNTLMEFGGGDDNSNAPLPQKNKNMMEKIYDLLPDTNGVEGESRMSSDTPSGGMLTYNFKQWGKGHHVDVKFGFRDDVSQLQFEPSEGLVKQRLIELWEQIDVPENWNLQDEKGRRQRQSEPNEEEKEEDSANPNPMRRS